MVWSNRSKTVIPTSIVKKAEGEDDDNSNLRELLSVYRGVMDMELSSSVYPTVLCSNSTVLLKRYPAAMADVFDQDSTLLPYVHFIPVHSNLSNLQSQVQYILGHFDDNHTKGGTVRISQILANAKRWCHTYMVRARSYRCPKIHFDLSSFLEPANWPFSETEGFQV